jgi:hypothetical protein
MAKAFGFNEEELRLLLVAVRQMRRTFAAAGKADPKQDLSAWVERYDKLHEKLLDMAGPLPDGVGELF